MSELLAMVAAVLVGYALCGLVTVSLLTMYAYSQALGEVQDGNPITLQSLWTKDPMGITSTRVTGSEYLVDWFLLWWVLPFILIVRSFRVLGRTIKNAFVPIGNRPLPVIKHKRKNMEKAREVLESMTIEELTEVTNDLLGERREQLSDLLQHRTRS